MNLSYISLICILFGCTPTPPPEPEPITPKPGATCMNMCAHLQVLGCPEGEDTPGGATCVEVCESTLEAGLDLHTDCVMGVTKCVDVDRASQGC
jgi:hypothetical protein